MEAQNIWVPFGTAGKASEDSASTHAKGKCRGKTKGKGTAKGKAKGKATAGGSTSTLPCVMKFLAPDPLVSAVIGKGGSTIAEIRTNCNVRIALTEFNEERYPNTDCRVMTVSAEEQESLDNAAQQIVEKVKELASGGEESDRKGDGNLSFRTIVPFAAVGGVIGKSGANIKQLIEATGATISIEDPHGSGPGADRVVSVSGTADAVEGVLKEVNTQIQLVNHEKWFSTWASNPGTRNDGSHGAKGKGTEGWPTSSDSGLNMMWDVAAGLPPYVRDDGRGYAMSCVVPDHLCGSLIGRGGAGIREVQEWTGTKIAFREILDDPKHRSLQISGSLTNSCSAYMIMMQRYLDAEYAERTPEW